MLDVRKRKKKKAVMIPILGLSNRKERVGFNQEEEYKEAKFYLFRVRTGGRPRALFLNLLSLKHLLESKWR